MSIKERKERIKDWCKRHESDIAYFAGGAVGIGGTILGLIIAEKILMSDKRDAFVKKNNDGSVGFHIVKQDIFGRKYWGDSICWSSLDKVKEAGNILIEAAEHTNEELDNIPGWISLE